MNDPQDMVQERLAQANWGFLSSQGFVLGLDLGSYGLRAALIDLQNRTYVCQHRDLPSKNAEEVVAGALELAHALLDERQIAPSHLIRIGVGFGGPVDARSGVVLLSPRAPGWEQFPLCERIEAAFGAATLLDNDANLIALAEATFGVGRDVQHLFYIHLSSGVGGGLVLNGRLYHGATTTAGEIGHAVVGPFDPRSQGDRPGTLEDYVSVQGLLNRAGELGLATNLLSDVFGDHPAGKQVVAEAVDVLSVRISQITALLDPQMIVLGGVVARNGGEQFLAAVQERTADYSSRIVSRSVPIVSSVLGFESVAIGGLALALESLQE